METKAAWGYRNLTRMLLRSDGLLERAAAALQRVVAAEPENAAALLRLGDVYRGTGKLREALECYRRVAALRPGDSTASWLVAILSGKALPDSPPDSEPAPFVRETDFLAPPRCRELLALALANRERFGPALLAARTQRTLAEAGSSHGKFLVDAQVTERKVRPWFEARLRDAIAEALPRLRIPEPKQSWVEMAMSAYFGGRYFSKHRDTNPPADTRLLNFVYYFHRQPRRFAGGELLLYDGDGTQAFTRIEPRHNSIVFFPAACLHQVAAFERDVADFRDARFALHGWLHRGARAASTRSTVE